MQKSRPVGGHTSLFSVNRRCQEIYLTLLYYLRLLVLWSLVLPLLLSPHLLCFLNTTYCHTLLCSYSSTQQNTTKEKQITRIYLRNEITVWYILHVLKWYNLHNVSVENWHKQDLCGEAIYITRWQRSRGVGMWQQR